MSLQQQFEAAARQVDNLDPAIVTSHMTDLYGLYKQATEGDVNTKPGEVAPTQADAPNGPAGLSQAQWESWDKYKGLAEDDAKRQYVSKVAEITGISGGLPGNDAGQTEAGTVPVDALTNAPLAPPINSPQKENDTTAPQPGFGPGDMTAGGLRGNLNAGLPYGGEDELKGAQ